ncbi:MULTISPECIES: oligopeptide/dipeptide ABC transporter ATP-binding protein [unclassified Solwaraspora]|uniref:oligopeptide/dipeptide ABC transporter ATP-binding protein n=1 Tax=unclassified Solwaraspora TaxID=2627926 RepID=UPI00259B3826|nr:oligopeptide/dipeptide ABC transporter ATP-binding protein [Solwaraspora sp. WMMA2056]WJK43028.1 ATP-binding cassette domain-containing protein [Solwaraspora sp. WMMA2056]
MTGPQGGPSARTASEVTVSAPTTAPPLVMARDIQHRYGGGRRWWSATPPPLVLREVNLDIAAGESLGLIGESGSGKSTLGRILLQLNRQSSGRVVFDGQDTAALSEAQLRTVRRRMQMVFQNPYASVNRRFTIATALTDPLRVNGIGDPAARVDRARELLDLVGLPDTMLDRYPHELSGGQLQRVCVARALILSPSFLVADEPTASLDSSSATQVVDLLARARAEFGLSLLFISHDLSVVARVADRIAVLYQGSLVEVGTAERILTAPAHPYTRALRAAIPDPDPRNRPAVRARPASEPDAEFTGAGCRFVTRCPVRLPVCADVAPPLLPVAPDLSVACHLVPAPGGHGPDTAPGGHESDTAPGGHEPDTAPGMSPGDDAGTQLEEGPR